MSYKGNCKYHGPRYALGAKLSLTKLDGPCQECAAMIYVRGSKLTASTQGHYEPSTHAVLWGAGGPKAWPNVHDVEGTCGQRGLSIVLDNGSPMAFNPDSAYSCRRCVNKVLGPQSRRPVRKHTPGAAMLAERKVEDVSDLIRDRVQKLEAESAAEPNTPRAEPDICAACGHVREEHDQGGCWFKGAQACTCSVASGSRSSGG